MTEQIGLDAIMRTTQFQQGLNQYLTGLNRAKGATQSAASTSVSAGGVITSALGQVLGRTIVGAAQAAAQALMGFVSSGISAVAELQRLEIMLTSLAAKELVASGAFENMSDAMTQAGPAADYLLNQLRELSLISPFEYTDVVNVFRLNMAFGSTSESAMQMTQAILDMASAMGLTGPFLERIVYNFSQMQMIGKITARDIRDLAMAGVDLTRVLREQLGMSVDEVNAALESGALTMQDVTNAFIEFSKVNFGGAAEKMSRTLGGLVSSFKDLSFFASKDLFGPVVEVITDDLIKLYEAAKQLIDSGALLGIGESLASAYQAMKNVPAAISGVISAITSRFGSGINDLISQAFDWGVNIVAQLANGIIQGAANFLIAAMQYINSLLTEWLSPGSPPRVAPMIDKWGAKAMEEYLGGFSDADFTALESLQGALSDAFGALNIEDDKLMSSLSEMYAEALSGGELDASFFDQLTAAAGPYGEEIAELAKLNLDLANSTEAVAAAERAVEEASRKEQAAREKSASLVNEYNDLLKAGVSGDVLQTKLDEINAQEQIVAEAAQQRSAAEMELEIQEARIDALKEQISLQEKIIDQLTKLYALPEPQPGGATEPGGEGAEPGGGGGGGGGAGEGGVTPGNLISSLSDIMDQAEQLVSDGAGGMRDILLSKLQDAFKPILDSWQNDIIPRLNRLGAEFNRFADAMGAKWAEIVGRFKDQFENPFVTFWESKWPFLQGVFETAMTVIRSAWDAMMSTLQPSIDTLAGLLEDLNIDFTTLEGTVEILALAFGTSLAVAIGTVTTVITILAGIVTGLVTGLTSAVEVAVEFGTRAYESFLRVQTSIRDLISSIEEMFVKIDEGDVAGTIDAWQESVANLALAFKNTFDTIGNLIWAFVGSQLAAIGGFVEGIIDFFTTLYNDLVGHSIVTDMFSDMIDVFTDGFADLTDETENYISLAIDQFTDFTEQMTVVIREGLQVAIDTMKSRYTELYNTGASIIQKIADGVKSKESYLRDILRNTITAAISSAISTIVVPDGAYTLGTAIATAVGQGFTDATQALAGAFANALSVAVSGVFNAVDQDFYRLGTDLASEIGDGAASSEAISNIKSKFLNAVAPVLPYVWNTFADDFYALGKDLALKFGDGLADNTAKNTISDKMASLVQAIIDSMQETIDNNEPGSSTASPGSATRSIVPATRMAMQPILGNTYNRTLNMPTSIVINNQMDAISAEAFVRRMIRNEFGV